MGVNKVEYYGETLIDTTGTTVSEDTLMEGETAINAAGEQITGKLKAVEYKAQSPTAEEQAQARENIDALGKEDLPEAINTALAQAKESGEFDGEPGTPGAPGTPGSDGVGIMTIEQVTISTEDGAKNVWRMTLTNGQTADFTVENGAKGSPGKSAYENAKAAGFTGTEEEFGDMLYNCISGNHEHRWDQITDRPFGKFPTEEGTDTVTSDDVVYGKFHRVSEFIPTLADLQQGGTITYHWLSGDAITGELVTISFPQGDYTIVSTTNGLMINSDGVTMVIISFNGKPQFGGFTFFDITEPGVYFDQGGINKCIHSLKINGYNGFKLYETRPLPKEYLPEDIGWVKTVNNIEPDENGNINIEAGGTVKTVNNTKPDENGNVNIETGGGVKSVNSVIPDENGNINIDTTGSVKTVNKVEPDEDGNIEIEIGGSSKADSAFNLTKSDTLAWNGDADGKAVVKYEDENVYIHVSDIIPTLAELQSGGSYRFTDFEETYTFTNEDLVETDDYIVVKPYNSIVVAKKDNVVFDEMTFPKQGIYFSYTNGESYLEYVTITDYTGFVKPILKMENMSPHAHNWYGKAISKGNTVRSDEVVHGGFVKVSDAVPTEAELRKGGVLRYYHVEDGEITGELITTNYLESPNGIATSNGEILIACDGVPMVQIKSTGTYFRQDQYDCIHSLTINGYEGFDYNVEKVPAELLPDNIGGGISSWNDLTDKPFGETTTTSDTLTWDGNTEGLDTLMGLYFRVSSNTPTVNELQNGGKVTVNLEKGAVNLPFTNDNVIDGTAIGAGDCIIISVADDQNNQNYILIASHDSTDVNFMGQAIHVEKAGIYFYKQSGYGYMASLKINNYNGFEMEVVKTIDPKYLPSGAGGGGTMYVNVSAEGMDETMKFIGVTASKTVEEVESAIANGMNVILVFDLSTSGSPGEYSFIPLASRIDTDEYTDFRFMTTTIVDYMALQLTVTGRLNSGWTGSLFMTMLATE